MQLTQIESVYKMKRNQGNVQSFGTLLNAKVKQFFAEDRSPFFQMQLPKHSQASAREGFNLTWSLKQSNSSLQTKAYKLQNLNDLRRLQLWRDDPLLLFCSLEIHPTFFLLDIHT